MLDLGFASTISTHINEWGQSKYCYTHLEAFRVFTLIPIITALSPVGIDLDVGVAAFPFALSIAKRIGCPDLFSKVGATHCVDAVPSIKFFFSYTYMVSLINLFAVPIGWNCRPKPTNFNKKPSEEKK